MTKNTSSSSTTYNLGTKVNDNDDNDDDDSSSSNSSKSSGGGGTLPGVSYYTSLSNAVITTTRAITNATFTAIKAATGIASPHYKAVLAGAQAQENSIRGTIGIDSYGAELVMKRAFDNGVAKSYIAQGLDPALQPVASGPMQRALAGVQITQEIRNFAVEFDEQYRNTAAYVTVPGQITSATAARIVGPLYDSLSELQKLGAQNSFMIAGNIDLKRLGCDYQSCQTPDNISGIAPGGLVLVQTNTTNAVIPFDEHDILAHELNHAGDFAITHLMNAYVKDPSLSAAEKEAAMNALRIFEMVSSDFSREGANAFYAAASNAGKVDQAGIDTIAYLAGYSEILAYQATDANLANYKNNISIHLKISPQEASKLVDDLINSPTILEIEKTQADYAGEFLK